MSMSKLPCLKWAAVVTPTFESVREGVEAGVSIGFSGSNVVVQAQSIGGLGNYPSRMPAATLNA